MEKCQRCGEETRVTTMSRFNTEIICMDCIEREKAHPAYAEAAATELAAVRRGDYNFPGVGCPSDLYQPKPS